MGGEGPHAEQVRVPARRQAEAHQHTIEDIECERRSACHAYARSEYMKHTVLHGGSVRPGDGALRTIGQDAAAVLVIDHS